MGESGGFEGVEGGGGSEEEGGVVPGLEEAAEGGIEDLRGLVLHAHQGRQTSAFQTCPNPSPNQMGGPRRADGGGQMKV